MRAILLEDWDRIPALRMIRLSAEEIRLQDAAAAGASARRARLGCAVDIPTLADLHCLSGDLVREVPGAGMRKTPETQAYKHGNMGSSEPEREQT